MINPTKPEIRLFVKLTERDYRIIKQEEIINDIDRLIVGIYETKYFKDNLYIICCNRIVKGMEDTLDYTKCADNKEKAEFFFNKIKNEVLSDLRRQ